MSWAHPEFRVSAFTVSGQRGRRGGPVRRGPQRGGALEFRGVPYRDSVPLGTLVLSSGLGGVFPKGIPVGTVTGTVREQAGWERVYRLRAGRQPGLGGPRAGAGGLAQRAILPRAFPSDSLLEAHAAGLDRADPAGRLAWLQAAKARARAARRGFAAARRTSPIRGGTPDRVRPGTAPASPVQGGTSGSPSPAPKDSAP